MLECKTVLFFILCATYYSFFNPGIISSSLIIVWAFSSWLRGKIWEWPGDKAKQNTLVIGLPSVYNSKENKKAKKNALCYHM